MAFSLEDVCSRVTALLASIVFFNSSLVIAQPPRSL
jgi:hypothetical protein